MKESKPSRTSLRVTMINRFSAVVCGLALSGAALAADAPQVSLKTSMGEIVLELDQEKAPLSAANFIQYVKAGFYKGTIFHRVIDGFMIQAGGMTADMKDKQTRKPIKIESQNGLSNLPYTVAMARTDDPNSATSQFFINVADNSRLDYPGMDGRGGYAVFGKVIKGQEVVDKIKAVVVDDLRGHQNVPVVPVVIQSASVVKAGKADKAVK
jgi:peptidyl-prolyl cis-trans isomerase A (cyclophilin A)/peptidyl-prolyl cis-trans isomerase B (cyclophilin B)